MKKSIFYLTILALLISTVLPTLGCANNNFPKIHTAPWPTSSKPKDFSQLKFVFLNLTLSTEYAKSIEVFNFGAPAICLASHDENKSLFIFLQDENDGYKELYDKAGAKDIYQFFSLMGNPDISNKNLIKIREIYGLNQAEDYIHYKKDKLDAFYIKSTDTKQSELFVLIADTPQIYKFNGYLTKEIVEQLLSFLSL